MGLPQTLSWALAEIAACAGAKRRLLALYDDRPDYHGFQEEPWKTDVESTGAEAAVALYANRFWQPWARRPQHLVADVGRDIEVKRRDKDHYDMILHETTRGGQIAVLVTGQLPHYYLHGWIEVDLAKARYVPSDPYGTKRPALWIPQRDLNPIETLPEIAL